KDTYARGGSIIDATVDPASLRLRPILMTSFASTLAVLPLAIATGPGAAGQNAAGLGVMGGMLAATPLSVVFVPSFFVVVLTLFKTKPKLLGSHAMTRGPADHSHTPSHSGPHTGKIGDQT